MQKLWPFEGSFRGTPNFGVQWKCLLELFKHTMSIFRQLQKEIDKYKQLLHSQVCGRSAFIKSVRQS